jgi:hypothetical protein
MLKNTAVPASNARGVWTPNNALYIIISKNRTSLFRQNLLTHPVTGSSAPAITAPNATPDVYPAFTRPMNKPLVFFPVSSSTRMIEIVKIPAAPTPLITRPAKKTAKDGARDVTSPPMEKMIDDTKIQLRAEKICDRRPASGEMLDIEI